MSNTTITVSTTAGLYAALAQATGGETILLAAGDYGKVTLGAGSGFDITFPSNVTIASANQDSPAVITGLNVGGAANVTFDGITFDYTFRAGDPTYTSPFIVSNSQNITITNSTFDGDVASGLSAADDGYGTGIGLSVYNSSGVTLTNNDISTFLRGMVVSGTENVVVSGNEIYDIRSDGMNFIAVETILIEDNYIHDFRASRESGDHADMIQFWTAGTTTPSTNITIRGNTLDIGDGNWTQSILIGNEEVRSGRAGTEMFYQNVVIENNTIYNSHYHGITVSETNGLVISNNTVVQVLDDGVDQTANPGLWVPTIDVTSSATQVTIANNVVSEIIGYTSQSGWFVQNNAFIQNTAPDEPGYYGNIFITSSMYPDTDGGHHYVATPNGMIDRLMAGSATTEYDVAPDHLTPQFQATEHPDNSAARIFDARLTTGPNGGLPAGTTYEWNFGDGTTATGATVEHIFANGDMYDVTLVVRLPDGQSAAAAGNVGVAGPQVLSFNSSDGSFHSYAYGEEEAFSLSAQALIATSGGSALALGSSGTIATVSSSAFAAAFNSDNFEVNFSLKGSSVVGNIGELFRVHTAFVASVNNAGELQFQLFDNDFNFSTVVSSGFVINDGAAHDISVALEAGQLRVLVDGAVAGQVAFVGLTAMDKNYGLDFGNPWGGANFNGQLTAFDITVDSADYAAGAGTSTGGSSSEEPSTDPVIPAPPPEVPEPTTDSVDETPTEVYETSIVYKNDQAILLGGSGVTSVDSTQLEDISGANNFDISFTLQGAGSRTNKGELFSLENAFTASVNQKGDLSFELLTTNGSTVTLTAKKRDVDDGAAHDISIQFEDGLLKLVIDGTTVTQQTVEGSVADIATGDLTFGNSWGGRDFSGNITGFELAVETPVAKVGAVLNAVAPVSTVVTADGIEHVLDIAALTMDGHDVQLMRDATTVSQGNGMALKLDGDGDYVRLGHLTDLEDSHRVAFSVDFSRDIADGSEDRLVWNHTNLGLALVGDGLQVHVATADQGFKTYRVDNLGLNDTDLHNAVVMLDDQTDRLQVLVDNNVVLDTGDADFTFASNSYQQGWSIGTAWDRYFDGTVTDFRAGDRFDFLEDYVPAQDLLVN